MALLTYDVNDEDLSRWGTPALLQETLELVVQKSLASVEDPLNDSSILNPAEAYDTLS
jgi:CRISPR/Cas system-associated endoribonuclease Cas2